MHYTFQKHYENKKSNSYIYLSVCSVLEMTC